MTRWIIAPAILLVAGAAQAQHAQPAWKPATVPTPPPTYVVPHSPDYARSAPPVLLPSPSDPYAGVTLPTQRGDAAYQGGGVVLEQGSDGVNRRIR